jgi:hypothetical protein
MNDDYFLRKIEDSHQAIAKTVSDFGAIVNNNNNEIVDLKRLVKDHVEKVDKILDSHDNSIKVLDEARTTIFSSIATTKWVASLLLTVITSMGAFIIISWSNGYDERLSKMEAESKEMVIERRETLDKVFQLLTEQKKLLNQSELKDIIANIYR